MRSVAGALGAISIQKDGASARARENTSTGKINLLRLIREAVDRLPSRYRAPIWLHYYEGMATQEVAVALRRSQDTVRKQLARGLRQLQTYLRYNGCLAAVPNVMEAITLLPHTRTPVRLTSAVEHYVETGVFLPVERMMPPRVDAQAKRRKHRCSRRREQRRGSGSMVLVGLLVAALMGFALLAVPALGGTRALGGGAPQNGAAHGLDQ